MAPETDLSASVSPNVGGRASLRTFEVAVRALSNSGISLRVPRDVDDILGGCHELLVSLSLPGRARICTIACIPRHRAAVDDAVIYGCEFDWSATMDPLGVVEDLLAYVLDQP